MERMLRNEAGIYDDTSLFLDELNKQVSKNMGILKRKIDNLENRLQAELDVGNRDIGLQTRIDWQREVRSNLWAMKDNLNRIVTTSSMEHFIDTYAKEYQATAGVLEEMGIGGVFNLPDFRAITTAINYPWSGRMWSDRVWANTNKVTEEVQTLITRALMTGEDSKSIAKMISAGLVQAGQNYRYVTERLIRTETARVRYVADRKLYDEVGLKKVKYCAFIDGKTSKTCRDRDGVVYDVGAEPPLPAHPHCRSTYLPVKSGRNYSEELDNVLAQEQGLQGKGDKPLAYAEKLTFKTNKYGDKEVWVRGNRYNYEDRDKKFFADYKKATNYKEMEAYARNIFKEFKQGNVSSYMWDFAKSMEVIHGKRDNILAPRSYSYALTKGEIKQIEKNFTSLKSKLTEREKEGIMYYSRSGYTGINRYLRKNGNYNLPRYDKEVHLPSITSGLSKGGLKKDTLLFRGADIDVFSQDFIDRLMGNPASVVGETFKDEGFMSTAIYGGSAFDKHISFQIMAKKGTEGAYINEFSHYKDIEFEFLLQKGTELRIKEVKRGRDDLHYTMLCEVVEK